MAETTTERSAWTLADLADCGSPDSSESPGAEWLQLVAMSAEDVQSEDDISQEADQCVPIYTHNRWQVFVDLTAYNEDTTELGDEGGDLTRSAGIALYMIAERLLWALWREREDEDEDED